MGTLYTTTDGSILTGLSSGVLTLNFTNGIVTTPNGTLYDMNTSLQKISTPNKPVTKCKSFMVFCSDADSVIRVGNLLTISDHQLTHVIHNYDFEQVQITIPENSTPDDTNQVAFMASDDPLLNYEPHDYWHDRGTITGTSTDTLTNYYTKHVGAYDDFYITTYNNNTGASGNSIDVKIYYSEDGVTFFAEQGYTSAVTITAGSYNSFATSRKHHFYRAQVNSTVTDSHATFVIFYNNVSVF